MPIIIKDYTWEETESRVFISIPLKGVQAHKVDIFSTEEYVKVSFPPYLFECFMYAPVYDEDSAAQIGNGIVVFKLQKHTAEIWGQLQHPDKDNKEKARERRIAAVERQQQRVKEQQEITAEKQRERQTHAIKEQMRIEHEVRTRIEDDKEAEKLQALEELEKWKNEQKKEAEEERERLLKQQKEREEIEDKERKEIEEAREKAMNLKSDLKNSETSRRKRNKKKDIFEEAAAGQTPRETGVIKVNFSHRDFPTAARESTAPDEDEWLRKQAESRRIRDLADTDLTAEEKNPVWLRDKGNEFFKAGNFQAAVNAFTHAIRMDFKMPSLYSNRAACHLRLRNFFKAIEDCQRALELLNPPVPQNLASRVRAHVRRGTAFCELEMYAEGLMDYEAALKIDPKNEQVRKDAERIRAEVQGEPLR